MNKIICCIYDKKSKTYDGFMLFENQAQAVRGFRMSCEKNEVFSKWPEDFAFVMLGEINCQTGELKQKTEKLAEALNFVEKKQPENEKATN